MSIPIDNAMTANLAMMEAQLYRASAIAKLAHEAMNAGQRNLAIGTILPLEQELDDICALLKTVLILHRVRPQPVEGG